MALAIPPRALFLLAVLTLVWGTNWPLMPMVLREMSVWTFRALACLLAGLTLLGYAAARGNSLRVPKQYWFRLTAAALTYLAVWNITSALASAMIPSGQAAILGFTMPLWAALISALFFGEKLTSRLVLALGFGAACVGLLMWRSLPAYSTAPLGLVLGLSSGLFWAMGTMILKRQPIPVPAAVLTGWQLLIAAIPLMLGALFLGHLNDPLPSGKVIAIALYIALVPMSIGNLCWFSIVALLPTNVAGLSSIMVPMVAMVSGAIVLGEPLGPVQLAAMACCAASLMLVLLKPKAVASDVLGNRKA
jgi:drug/metabolite transporter (DMT)-like permease